MENEGLEFKVYTCHKNYPKWYKTYIDERRVYSLTHRSGLYPIWYCPSFKVKNIQDFHTKMDCVRRECSSRKRNNCAWVECPKCHVNLYTSNFEDYYYVSPRTGNMTYIPEL